MSRAVDQIVMDALKTALLERLAQCSEKQQAFFGNVYPMGVDAMPEADLRSAVDLCDRTIAKNQKDPTRLSEASAS